MGMSLPDDFVSPNVETTPSTSLGVTRWNERGLIDWVWLIEDWLRLVHLMIQMSQAIWTISKMLWIENGY